ncbi:MAG: LysM peptidoglycan-binding domain-containing protein [Gammaproteobacteria bacterium]|nr:MAG: LysM peptidoglycan-binding domain-containing protein [Gammaproteobacteria bacterium]TLZ59181.1 MAG: LysM peptidoglycan-binding domain-containing protein [Gammaproteobacteria bacterium]
MSSISVPRAASKRVTGCARVRSRGSGYSRMVLRAMGRACNMGAAAPVIQRTNLTLNRMPAGCHASITTKISAAGAQVRPRNEEWRMVSNQVLVARLATGLLILGFALSGCSHFRSHQQASTESAAPATVSGSPSSGTPAEPEVTATEAAANAAGTRTVVEPPPPPDTSLLKPGAPMHYTVKRGDTLWGIATMYLKDPWLWPEVWIINPQIPNPHLIYPGDTLALAFGADGRPQISVEQAGAARLEPRLRSTALDNAIPTIPYSAIAAFLSRPSVMSSEQISHAPYVLAFRDRHEVAGSGNEVYVRNLSAGENARFAVVHVATPLRDPDDGKVVGYEGIYTATALVQRPGDPAKALLIDPARETLRGDRLLSTDASETPINFALHAPAAPVHGRIIDVVGGVELVGQYQVVVINRGKRHGLEAGNVLAVDQAGDVVHDLYRGGRNIGSTVGIAFAPKVRLPDERSGTLLVFKVFDRLSYGLIVGASNAIHVADVVRNP